MGSRILLADDSITIQKVVNLTFQDEGIEVVSVSNGDMAERRLKEVNPDLVLADIFMPGKNGYELCESIKQDPELSSVPVVLLVGAFEPFNEAEARRVHADAHLTKPFESRVLVETVRALMAKYPKPQPAPVATQPIPETAATFPAAQAIATPPFHLDTALMGEPYSTAFNNQEFPPLHTQPSQPETAFTDQAPLANFVEATPFTEAFPATFETNSAQEAPTFTIEQAAQTQGDFPATTPSQATEPAPAFEAVSHPATTDYEEAPLQLDESINLNPELINFYEQYDKSPSNQEMTRVLGSYTPAIERGGQSETAFDLVVDFDRVETIEESKPDRVVGFDVDTFADPANAGEAMLNQRAAFTDTSPAAKKFDTNELESKAERDTKSGSNLTTAPINDSSVNYQNGMSSQPSTALPGGSSHSEILAADEPLGDVLTNLPPVAEPVETISAHSPLELDDSYFATAQSGATVTPEPASLPVSETVLPVVEASLTEAQATAQETPVQMTAMPVADAPSQDAPSQDAPSQDAPSQDAPSQMVVQPDFAEVQPVNEVASPVQATPATFDPAESSRAASPVAEPLAQAETVVEPMVEPVRAKTPSPYNGLDKNHTEATNLLAEFTPVNLAAVAPQSTAFDSSAQELVSENSAESTAASQALGEQQASVPELPSSSQPEAMNHQGGAMSQEMIDEIVRRVVAQLSDSVVREIAWEVVPDCVERVVNNLTREGMNNKLAN